MGKWSKKSISFVTSFVLAGSLLAVPVGSTAQAATTHVSPVVKSVLSFKIEDATISELEQAMQSRKLTSEQLVKFYLDRIAEYDDSINSIITINKDALAEAKQMDQERKAGKVRGALHGIPVILKDNFDTYDMPTTAGFLVT